MTNRTRHNLLIGIALTAGVASAVFTGGFGLLSEDFVEYAPAPVFASVAAFGSGPNL